MQLINAKNLRALLLAVLVVLVGSNVLVYGQGTSGSLTGQITDPSGAAIVGATVTLTNVGTNFSQIVTADSTGIYLFKPVQPGNYSLMIVASGFANYVQKGIVINANLYATQNVRLAIATVKGETVNVTANAELINTTSAELGTTVNEYSVSQLPLNGRDPSQLALLAPGMIDGVNKLGFVVQGGFSFPNESGASANGGRQGSTYYMLDGVSNMDNYMAVNSPTPNPDAIQEFRLISNNYSAVYGFSSGGVVSMVTKSGTNKFHGGLFEFLRNQDLNAKEWNSGQLDPLKRNQFGGDVGGPVFRDKLFFFGSYQGTRSVGTGASSKTNTPTANMMAGDFSGLVTYAEAQNPTQCGPSGSGYGTTSCGWLNGPFHTVNGVPNQLIGGAAALDPVAVQFTQDGLPGQMAATAGSTPSLTSQDLTGGMYYNAAAIRNNIDEYTVRLDYDLSKSQRLTLRSFTDNFTQPSGDVPGNVLSVLNLTNWVQGFGESIKYYNEMLQHTWTLNSSTVNTASVLWTQQSAHNAAAVKDHNGKDMCWSRYINITELPGQCYMEGAYFGGSNGGWTEPSQEVRSTMGFSDTLIKTIHRHTLSAGMDLQRQSAVENTQYPTTAIINFDGTYTGNGLADWLLGYMKSYEQGAGEIADVKGWQIDPYVNDEFRLRPGLTLTAGVRWDPDLAPTSVGGRGAAFVLGQQSIMYPNAPTGLIFPGDKGMNAQLRPSNYGYWEPRIGVAYQPQNLPRTSFHAGFGLFTGPVAYSSYNHVADVAPFSPTFSPAPPSYTALCSSGGTAADCTPSSGQAVAGYMNFHNPWQTSTFGTGGVSPFPPFASISYKPPSSAAFPTQSGGQVYLGASFGRNFKAGMTESWNFSVEQQISPTMAFRVAYVGSESYHQSYVRDDNPGIYNPNHGGANVHGSARALNQFTQILEQDSDATGNYHSLQVSFDRHMAHGLQAQSSFTWQKTIDVASASNISFGTPEIGDPFDLRWNRGISTMSIPFNWVSNFVYQTPELKGQNLLMREVLGGWGISPIITLQSGAPFGVSGGNSRYYDNVDPTQNGTGSGSLQGGDRADRVAGQSLKVRQGSRSQWIKQYFNPAAFVPNKDGTFGNSGRNLMNGPPTFNIDSALMKNWQIYERYQLQFRVEMFNAFNHPIMGNPDTNPSDSTFGQINAGNGSAGNASRVGQAALKFTF
ncbi:MAG: carboxypeptidase-like regulatory domain-containing protein [Terracidiphilus sp.]